MARTKKEIWYRFTFADGHWECCRGLSACERKHIELEHGKLVSKTVEFTYG